MVGIGSQILQGEGELKDVSAIQRLGKVAAAPLVSLFTSSLGLLASSTYSTTALAVNGGLSIVRIGVGTPFTLCIRKFEAIPASRILSDMHIGVGSSLMKP